MSESILQQKSHADMVRAGGQLNHDQGGWRKKAEVIDVLPSAPVEEHYLLAEDHITDGEYHLSDEVEINVHPSNPIAEPGPQPEDHITDAVDIDDQFELRRSRRKLTPRNNKRRVIKQPLFPPDGTTYLEGGIPANDGYEQDQNDNAGSEQNQHGNAGSEGERDEGGYNGRNTSAGNDGNGNEDNDDFLDEEYIPEAEPEDDQLSDFVGTDDDTPQDDAFCEPIDNVGPSEVANEVFQNLAHGQVTDQSMPGIEVEYADDGESEYAASDELHSPDDDDDEDTPVSKTRFPEFNSETGFTDKIELRVGMKFRDHIEFRQALQHWAITAGFDYVCRHNEKCLVSAGCKAKCDWYISASWSADHEVFQIKVLTGKHVCGRQYYNTKVKSKWLAAAFFFEMKDLNRKQFVVSKFKEIVKRKYGVHVSRDQAYRAKRIVDDIIEGKRGEQYKKIRSYCAAMEKWNAGSRIDLKLQGLVFKRLYVGMNGCIQGFKDRCRPIICLDACFLKGSFTGQLHAAVGFDANDNMYPIAYAVCETEGLDTWGWFLENLFHDVGSVEDHGWTIMSDHQKGLESVLKNKYPSARRRLCVRHMHVSFKKEHKGKELKDMLWNAARATTEVRHKYWMMEIQKISLLAYQYLIALDPELWCRYAFSTYPKSDVLLNNICESFNALILEAREKPILTMLEMIRTQLMRRMHKKREGMLTYTGSVCPRIQKKLEKSKEEANSCIAQAGGGMQIEISHMSGEVHVVDLNQRTCTCRRWDLTGIPCGHAVCAIRYDRLKTPEDYVHTCYSKTTFMATYDHVINPMPGPELWPDVPNLEPVQPPFYLKQRGAPKKKRRREADEPVVVNGRLSKKGVKMRCGKCQQDGHNSRTCKGQLDPEREAKSAAHAKKAAERRVKLRTPGTSTTHHQTGNEVQQRPICLPVGASPGTLEVATQPATSRTTTLPPSSWAQQNSSTPAPFDMSRFSFQPRHQQRRPYAPGGTSNASFAS